MYMETAQQENAKENPLDNLSEEEIKQLKKLIIDVIQKLLSCFFFNINEIIDYRIVVNIVIKTAFYLYQFLGEEENKYEGQSFFFTTILWVIFDILILYDVYHYIKLGNSIPCHRNRCYKAVDMLQSSVALVYFAIKINNGFKDWLTIVLLVIVVIDLAINIIQLMCFCNQDIKYKIESPPTLIWFYSAILLGTVCSFAILILAFYHYKEIEENQEAYQQSIESENGFEFIKYVINSQFIELSMIGEGVIVILCIYLIYREIKNSDDQRKPSSSKICLSIFYGIALGAFNYFYAIILAILASFFYLKFYFDCLNALWKECKKIC